MEVSLPRCVLSHMPHCLANAAHTDDACTAPMPHCLANAAHTDDGCTAPMGEQARRRQRLQRSKTSTPRTAPLIRGLIE